MYFEFFVERLPTFNREDAFLQCVPDFVQGVKVADAEHVCFGWSRRDLFQLCFRRRVVEGSPHLFIENEDENFISHAEKFHYHCFIFYCLEKIDDRNYLF